MSSQGLMEKTLHLFFTKAMAINQQKSRRSSKKVHVTDEEVFALLPACSDNASPEFEAARSVLGAAMLSPSCARTADELLEPEDFLSGTHRTIFVALRGILRSGAQPDLVGVSSAVAGQVSLAELAGMTNVVSGEAFTRQWSRIILDAAEKRRLVAAAQRVISDARAGAGPEEIRDRLACAIKTAGAPASKKRFCVSRLFEIASRPPDWVVRNIITRNCLALLFSDPGGCKTFLAVPMACSVATGQPFYGHQVEQGPVVDMGAFIQAADQIRVKYQAALLLIHHSGHGDKSRARGSVALKGAVDFEFRLTRGDDDIVRMDCTKSKDFEPPAPMAFRLRSVELPLKDRSGQPVTSAVLDATDYNPPLRTTNAGRGKNQNKALGVLKTIFEHHRANVREAGRDPAGARVTIDEWQLECKLNAEIPRNRFREVCRSLEEAGTVEIENGLVHLC